MLGPEEGPWEPAKLTASKKHRLQLYGAGNESAKNLSGQAADSALEPPEMVRPCRPADLSLLGPVLDSDLQNTAVSLKSVHL